MPGKPGRRSRGRRQSARRRARRTDLRALLPLRPTSKAWTHWNRAAVEVLHGVRAVLDECIGGVERLGRRRQESPLKRIRVE